MRVKKQELKSGNTLQAAIESENTLQTAVE